MQFQGLGGRILVILDCAVLAGLDWNAAWLHDVWFFVCCTLPTSQSSQNLTAAHLFSLPPPQRAPPSPPTVRMQPLNPSPDNGKSARWSLFPVSHPPSPSPTPRVLKGCRLSVILKLPLANEVPTREREKQGCVGWGFPALGPGLNLFPLFTCWS